MDKLTFPSIYFNLLKMKLEVYNQFFLIIKLECRKFRPETLGQFLFLEHLIRVSLSHPHTCYIFPLPECDRLRLAVPCKILFKILG